jgi:hypothetical protein
MAVAELEQRCNKVQSGQAEVRVGIGDRRVLK